MTTTTTTSQSYTQWITDPIKAKISEAASDYAARPVAPGADREQIVEMSKPWVAIASVAIAATAARIAMHQTGADAEIAIATSIAAFAVAVVLGVQAKRRLLCVKRRTRVYAFLAAAAGWTVAAMLTGVTGPMMFTLAIVGIGTSLWHWADHRLGYGWDAPQHEAIYAPTPDVDVYAPLWEQNLAGPGKVLHGTQLTHYEHLRFGARYAMEVVPGVHTLEEVDGLAAKIRSGLRLKRNHKLIIEEHPTLEAPTLLITIIDSSPVANGTSWPGAAAAMNPDGTIWIGPYLDGEGKALWKLYSTNRIHNGMIAGGTGSGKSRLLENIAMTAAASEQFPTAIWFADGQDGLSSPLLMRNADYYAGKPEQILAMLREAVEVIVMQGDENKVNGVQGFTPTQERPGLLIILDECKLVLDKQNNPEFWEETQRLVARIATTGNKAGVGIILAGQEATLPTFGGGGQYPAAIRNNIKGANGVLLKSEEVAGGIIFGVPAATMRSIPSGGGYGFVAGGEGFRKAMMRGFYDDDETTARNMGNIFWRSISQTTALDLSDAYRNRKSDADEDLEAAKLRVQKRRQRHEAAQRGEHVPAPVREAQATAQAADVTTKGSPFMSFTLKSASTGQKQAAAGSAQRVLDAVGKGHTGWKEIASASGLGRDMVFKHLKDLRDQGLVEQAQRGEWTLKGQRAA